MPIVKYKFDSNFTQVHNDVARDTRLTFEARGVLMYLLSRCEEWNPCLSDIADQGGLGMHKTRRILAELEAAGYVKKSQPRTSGGARFGSSMVTDYALPCTGPRVIESPNVDDSPQAENQRAENQPKSDELQCSRNQHAENCNTKTLTTKERELK
mgnify:CR=1 FL=1